VLRAAHSAPSTFIAELKRSAELIMKPESTPIREINEKRIMVELELQRMSESRARTKKRAESQVVFFLYLSTALSAALFFGSLFYWSRQHHDTKADIVIIAFGTLASALIGILIRMYLDIKFIRNELEKKMNQN
jgi:hypothetical protein